MKKQAAIQLMLFSSQFYFPRLLAVCDLQINVWQL